MNLLVAIPVRQDQERSRIAFARAQAFARSKLRTLELPGREGVMEAIRWLQRQSPVVPWTHVLLMHDDVLISEWAWDERLAAHFAEHPRCVIVGFGGATGFAHPDIKELMPAWEDSKLGLLARRGFASNLVDAEVHGRREVRPFRAAQVDGLAMCFAVDFFRTAWQGFDLPHHNYDSWACLEALERGLEVWCVPVACRHLGGRTALSQEYAKWVASTKWGSDTEVHRQGHELLFKKFQALLPI